jgi:hypothetical protein
MTRRTAIRAALTAATAALMLGAGASTATASTVFGADLTNTPDWPTSQYSMTAVIDPGGAADTGAPLSGILTSVRIKTRGAGGTGVIRILTLTSHPDAFTYNFLNDGPEIPVTVTADATPTGHITEVLTRRPIAAGQHLGWYVDDVPGNIKENYVDASAECAYTAGSTAGPSTTQPYSTAACNHNVPLLSGTIEPDADHDGYGDETQDQCPTDATTQAACPASTSTAAATTTPSTTPPPKRKCKKKKHRAAAVAKKCKKHRK